MKGISKTSKKIVDKYRGKEDMLIQVLLDLQNSIGWLPEEALDEVSKRLEVPITQVYQAASFYKAFSFAPKGRHTIKVCLGTACQIRGGPTIMDRVQEVLKIKEGETTPDMRFTLERVNCLGCCALGPVMVVDQDYHGGLTTAKVKKVLDSYD